LQATTPPGWIARKQNFTSGLIRDGSQKHIAIIMDGNGRGRVAAICRALLDIARA